ncbi:MAG: serine/threonine-protein kinase [Vicinamibacteria bacterium]
MSAPPAGAPLGPGSVLASRYDIRRVLGRGGMGMVYEAHDRLLDERVAIKVLRPDVATSSELEQRFRAEIKIARAVSHRNVCRIHEYGEDGDLRFISMAYVDGTDLKAVLRAKGALPAAEAFDVLVPVAEALAAIHDEGIVHRDLKTPNIMIDSRGVVRVMDFGIAKQSGAEGLDMTATGQIVGTPEYMSPEQVHGRGLDGRSDLYSLGVVAFELFTGRTPFRAETPLATVLLHLNEPPPLEGPPAEKLPAAMVPVLRRALAKSRDERYADAREMTRALVEARSKSLPATDRFAKTVEAPGGGAPGQP